MSRHDETILSEEVINSALYAVKFRRRHNLICSPGETAVEVTKTITLTAASLERLVTELLINRESTFVHVFFSTYRAFTTTEYVVDEIVHQIEDYPLDVFLSDQFNSSEALGMRSTQDAEIVDIAESESGWRARNVQTVVKIWLKEFSEDFIGKPVLCDKLRKVVELSLKNTFFDEEELMLFIESVRDKGLAQSCLSRTLSIDHAEKLSTSSSTVASLSASESMDTAEKHSVASLIVTDERHNVNDDTDDSADLDSCSPFDMAVELTKIESGLFLRVRPYECLAAIWSKRGRDTGAGGRLAGSVMDTVEQFNRVCSLVMTSCLQPPRFMAEPLEKSVWGYDASGGQCLQRACAVGFWIRTAQECRNLRNYSSLRAILSALGSSSVSRLQKTWESVDKQTLAVFSDLSALTSTDGNEHRSRELLTKEGTAKDIVNQSSGGGREDGSMLKRLIQNCKDSPVIGTPPPDGNRALFHNNEDSSKEKSGKRKPTLSGQDRMSLDKDLSLSCSKKASLKNRIKSPILGNRATISLPQSSSLPRSVSENSIDKIGQVKSPTSPYAPTHDIEGPMERAKKVLSSGVVPYLGIFLTDLTMVDSAHGDTVTSERKELKDIKLLNFGKRRKEFEILAQISLFQKQAQAYRFGDTIDPFVKKWIKTSDVMDEQKCYEESKLMEGQPIRSNSMNGEEAGSRSGSLKRTLKRCTSAGTRDLHSTGIFTQSPTSDVSRPLAKLKSSLSVSNLSRSKITPPNSGGSSVSVGATSSNIGGVDSHVVRVALHTSIGKVTTSYQTLLLTSGMKARQLMEKILDKQSVQASVADLQLYQVLTETKFMPIRSDVNVFYAIKTEEVSAISFYVTLKDAKPPTKLPSQHRKNGFLPSKPS
eukprot:scpid26544/ scgid18289/ Ral guanine nucleotide dissociation stimulator; Ral guanine nucleotide exchange factor